MKYFGPFKIIERIGAVAYKLELPGSARINLVFHVSLLKKFRGDSTNPYMPLPLQTETESPILQPFQVLASRTIIQGSILTPQILVQWENTELADATWENVLQEAYG